MKHLEQSDKSGHDDLQGYGKGTNWRLGPDRIGTRCLHHCSVGHDDEEKMSAETSVLRVALTASPYPRYADSLKRDFPNL